MKYCFLRYLRSFSFPQPSFEICCGVGQDVWNELKKFGFGVGASCRFDQFVKNTFWKFYLINFFEILKFFICIICTYNRVITMENFSDLGPPIFEKSRFFKTPESPILWVPQLQPGATPTWCAQIKIFFANLPPQIGASKWATKFLGTKQPFEP